MIIQVTAIAVAAVASFLLSTVWYVALGRQLARLHPAYADAAATPAWRGPVELLRTAVLAAVVGQLCGWLGVEGVGSALGVAVLAWVGFPVVLLSGSVLHERVPWRLAAIHAGDWLLKLVAVTLIVGLWR